MLRRRCRHRPVQYLNNIIEQDHRAIKRRVNAKQGFRNFHAADRTIRGYEAIHKMRKEQVRWLAKGDVLGQRAFIHSLFGISASKLSSLQGTLCYSTTICDRSDDTYLPNLVNTFFTEMFLR